MSASGRMDIVASKLTGQKIESRFIGSANLRAGNQACPGL